MKDTANSGFPQTKLTVEVETPSENFSSWCEQACKQVTTDDFRNRSGEINGIRNWRDGF